MNLNETIINLARRGYIVRFKRLSSFAIEILVSNGRFFTVHGIDITIDNSDEILCAILEIMKEEVDRMDVEHRKEKHYGCN